MVELDVPTVESVLMVWVTVTRVFVLLVGQGTRVNKILMNVRRILVSMMVIAWI